MKKLHLIIYLFTAFAIPSFSQQAKFIHPIPPKGYYRSLQVLSPEPKSPAEAIDKQKFPAPPKEKLQRLKPYYLSNATPDNFYMPDPPANSSEQTRAELNYLLQLQQQRTRLDEESSLYMAGVFYDTKTKAGDSSYHHYRRNLFHIGRSVGTWFNPVDLPLTAELISHVWQDASYFIWSFKYMFLRVRPYVLEPDIQNLQETEWAAYPSGHAANSYVNAYLFQELAPEFEDVFIKDAYDMAHSREIIGVHYPSDSEAGRLMARQLVNMLFTNEKFLTDFQLAKREWTEKAKENFTKPPMNPDESIKTAPSCGVKASASPCAKTCQR